MLRSTHHFRGWNVRRRNGMITTSTTVQQQKKSIFVHVNCFKGTTTMLLTFMKRAREEIAG